MYAVLSSGGKQYRVEPGSTLTIERLTEEAGASVTFDRVLLIADGDDVTVGTPIVSGATISATILGEELGPKIVVFKFKQKAKYRRRTGHRQHLTRVRIDEISADGRSSRRAPAKEEPPVETKAPKAEAAPEAEAAPKAKSAAKAKVTPKASAVKAETEAKAEAKTAAKPRARRTAASAADDAPKKPAPKRAAKPKPAKE